MDERPDLIPLSMLNALVFCERRFYYEFVLGEMLVNHHVLEGSLRHERVHEPGAEREGERVVQRRLYVYSDRYRVAGFVDLVEETEGELAVVEYKKGRRGDFASDQVQLCAQALCLEERLGVTIRAGAIFYFGSRRRHPVEFSAELRAQTVAAIERAHKVALLPDLPPPLTNWNKCRHCSLEPLCLPRETLRLREVEA
ncbi:MAG TPA: CRISPR-associated protein Cas4 [Ardenticatenaceae bacterium]|nr:CRISPR-associated protein Cas4 [Ardenticatenaceae bacterium]